MARPTRIEIDATALLHNVRRVKQVAPHKKIIAMVKANAYGCGLSSVLPSLEDQVDAFGVASVEEALFLRQLGSRRDCVLFQGVFSSEELNIASSHQLQCVIHQPQQLQWLINTPLSEPISVWIKVNTGMHRLGFHPQAVSDVAHALINCPWVKKPIGLMTHLACADEPHFRQNQQQLEVFNALHLPPASYVRSIANSAAILSLPLAHADVIRPGIMLYGVSPFANETGVSLGLMPVMRLVSIISAVNECPAHANIGYGASWQSIKPSLLGIVPVGYGDGYPRHIQQGYVYVNHTLAPIVGRISMDMLTVDLTHCPHTKVGDAVELWGKYIPIEHVAKAAGTIAYELMCQVSARVRASRHFK